MNRRKEAAAKIFAIWSSIKEKKREERKNGAEVVEEKPEAQTALKALSKNRIELTCANYSSKQFTLARMLNNELVPVLH